MSYIPDCRSDDYYNQTYLNKTDHDFVRGFDWCAEQAVDNFFDNLDNYFGEDTYLGHVLEEKLHKSLRDEYEWKPTFGDEPEKRTVETYADLLRAKLLEWIEMERDELITSMIDNMDEDEYNRIKAEVDSAEAGNPENDE